LTSTEVGIKIKHMRKEPFFVGDYVHVFNRGNRKMDIVRDNIDRWRFLSILRYFNDQRPSLNILRELINMRLLRFDLNSTEGNYRFDWPKNWPAQKPLVRIVSYALMPNHYHLLLQEITEGGISIFMKKLGNGLTGYINIKYNEAGKIFQGSYKAKTVKNENYLQYLDAYIQVLNPFELLSPEFVIKSPRKAFLEVAANPFSSLGESLGLNNLQIVDRKSIEREIGLTGDREKYLKLINDIMAAGGLKKILGELLFD
jgi:putative transposase